MNVKREKVAKALFDLLNENAVLVSAGFKTFNRRLKMWSQVDSSDKPAMFLVNYDEEHERKAITGPDKGIMEFMLVVYDDASDPNVIPSERMNNFLDAIDAALTPDPMTSLLTLGGIVQHCWVEGIAKVSPGDLDNQSVATYPIRVLVP